MMKCLKATFDSKLLPYRAQKAREISPGHQSLKLLEYAKSSCLYSNCRRSHPVRTHLYIRPQCCAETNETVRAFADALDVSSESPGVGKIKVFFSVVNETSPKASDASKIGPLPVVLLASGYGLESTRYQWLAERIVREAKVVFVSYDHQAVHRGKQSFYAGIWDEEREVLKPGIFKLILNKLTELNKEESLAGRMDLDRVVSGGHSLGGIVALCESNRELLPAVKGVFTFGSRTSSSPLSHFSPTLQPVAGDVPLLYIVGTSDEVLLNVGRMYDNEEENPIIPIRRTFSQALDPQRQAYYVELDGADHMFIVDPDKNKTDHRYLDSKTTISVEVMRDRLCNVFVTFIKQHVLSDDSKVRTDFRSFCETHNNLISHLERVP